MFAKLSALVGSAPAFPYTIAVQHDVPGGAGCTSTATSKTLGLLFPYSDSPLPAKQIPSCRLHGMASGASSWYAGNEGGHYPERPQMYSCYSAFKLMQVRHPNILAFRDMQEVVDKGQTVIYLVTEPVLPLVHVLSELDMNSAARYSPCRPGLVDGTAQVTQSQQ